MDSLMSVLVEFLSKSEFVKDLEKKAKEEKLNISVYDVVNSSAVVFKNQMEDFDLDLTKEYDRRFKLYMQSFISEFQAELVLELKRVSKENNKNV